MAIDYGNFFDRMMLYAGIESFGSDMNVHLDTIQLFQSALLFRTIDDSNNLRDLITADIDFKDTVRSESVSYRGLFDNYLQEEGRDTIQSSGQTSTAIMEDLVTVMTRDAQTVLANTIGNAIVYDRAGDGTVSTITQNQMTINDTLTLTCLTAQNGGDATFALRSKIWGNISTSVVLTADGVTSYDDDDFAVSLGIDALVIDEGSGGNEWAVSDQITITTTSDDESILLSYARDAFRLELPSSVSPTISNLWVVSLETFPVSPEDGQMVVIDGILYIYDEEITEWVENGLL